MMMMQIQATIPTVYGVGVFYSMYSNLYNTITQLIYYTAVSTKADTLR